MPSDNLTWVWYHGQMATLAQVKTWMEIEKRKGDHNQTLRDYEVLSAAGGSVQGKGYRPKAALKITLGSGQVEIREFNSVADMSLAQQRIDATLNHFKRAGRSSATGCYDPYPGYKPPTVQAMVATERRTPCGDIEITMNPVRPTTVTVNYNDTYACQS